MQKQFTLQSNDYVEAFAHGSLETPEMMSKPSEEIRR